MRYALCLTWLFFALYQTSSQAATEPFKVGTIIRIKGNVKIYRDPIKDFKTAERLNRDKRPLVLYMDQYWQAFEGKQRMNLFEKDVVATSDGQMIALVNRKKLVVSPSTFVELHRSEEQGGQSEAFVSLLSGKLRASINKMAKDKRGSIKLRTRSAVMGVRGTDLFITYGNRFTQVATLEGEVEVKGAAGDQSKAVRLMAGKASKIADPLSKSEKKQLAATLSAEDYQKRLAATQPSAPETISPALMGEIRANSKGILDEDPILEQLESVIDSKRLPEEN